MFKYPSRIILQSNINDVLNRARTLTAEGIHQVHFSSGGSSLVLLGNRRTLINFKTKEKAHLQLL